MYTKDTAIVLAVENNTGTRTGKGEPFRYEDELILCCSSWRKNAGKYKDIPIYAICPSKKTLPDNVKDKLSELNVTYIESYFKETEDFPCAWYNKPLVTSFFETCLNYKRIVHLDLDCYLIKEVDDSFFEIPDGYEAKIAYYSEKEQQDINSEVLIEYNTGCIVAKPGFYTRWYHMLMMRLDECRDTASHKFLCELEESVLSETFLLEELNFRIFNWVDPTLEDVYLYRRYNIEEYHGHKDKYFFFHDHISNENITDLAILMSKVYRLNSTLRTSS